MIITRTSEDVKRPLTAEQKEMLLALKNAPVIPDEDCPEITPEEFADFKRVSKIRRNERLKQSVTIRLSPQTLEKARSLGKGYTSILGRIIENALSDPEELRKAL